MSMYVHKNELLAQGITKASSATLKEFLDRLLKLKDDVLRFFTDLKVPYCNNLAEKSYRLSKKKMQITGTFRACDGGERFATIFSIIDTCRKNGLGPIEALSQVFAGTFSFHFLNQPAE